MILFFTYLPGGWGSHCFWQTILTLTPIVIKKTLLSIAYDNSKRY